MKQQLRHFHNLWFWEKSQTNYHSKHSDLVCFGKSDRTSSWYSFKTQVHNQVFLHPSSMITLPEANIAPTLKMVVSNRNLLSRGLFSGAMLVSGRVLPTSTHPNYPNRFERFGSFGCPLSLPLHKPKLPCVRHTAQLLSQHHLVMHGIAMALWNLGMNLPIKSTANWQISTIKNPSSLENHVKVLNFLLLCHENQHQTNTSCFSIRVFPKIGVPPNHPF